MTTRYSLSTLWICCLFLPVLTYGQKIQKIRINQETNQFVIYGKGLAEVSQVKVNDELVPVGGEASTDSVAIGLSNLPITKLYYLSLQNKEGQNLIKRFPRNMAAKELKFIGEYQNKNRKLADQKPLPNYLKDPDELVRPAGIQNTPQLLINPPADFKFSYPGSYELQIKNFSVDEPLDQDLYLFKENILQLIEVLKRDGFTVEELTIIGALDQSRLEKDEFKVPRRIELSTDTLTGVFEIKEELETYLFLGSPSLNSAWDVELLKLTLLQKVLALDERADGIRKRFVIDPKGDNQLTYQFGLGYPKEKLEAALRMAEVQDRLPEELNDLFTFSDFESMEDVQVEYEADYGIIKFSFRDYQSIYKSPDLKLWLKKVQPIVAYLEEQDVIASMELRYITPDPMEYWGTKSEVHYMGEFGEKLLLNYQLDSKKAEVFKEPIQKGEIIIIEQELLKLKALDEGLEYSAPIPYILISDKYQLKRKTVLEVRLR